MLGKWIRSEGAGRNAALAVAVAVLVWLGWQIIGNTAADTVAGTDPHAALSWRANNARALLALAEDRLSGSQEEAASPDEAAGLARRALAANPLQEGALRVLAQSADANGDTRQTGTLMRLAAGRSLRDTTALVWLFNQSVRDGRPAEALHYVDAILRTRPDLQSAFAEPLVTLADNPDARPDLIKMLAGAPAWRSWFLGQLAAKAPEPSITYAVLSGLAATSDPPTDGELGPYLNRLIGEGQYQLAFLAWWHFLPATVSKTIPFVFNGNFERPVSGLPFDWMIGGVRGATTTIVDTGDKDHGHALRVVFGNTRVPYRQVSKLLVLPPGKFELSGEVSADHLVNERGMMWRIFCADDAKVTLATTGPVAGTSSWHGFHTRFEVPPTGCKAQWLRLELAARFPIEEQVSGAISYDNLAIRWASAADASQ